ALRRLMALDDAADATVGGHRAGRSIAECQELRPEFGQRPELLVHGGELPVEQGEHMLARRLPIVTDGEHLANLLQGQADRPRLEYEAQALPIRVAVEPVAGRRAARRGEQPNGFIVAQRLGIKAELRGELADAHLPITLPFVPYILPHEILPLVGPLPVRRQAMTG